mmetsp:Transcript_24645/g.38723  ORF Transcript_24645/g.38723 Transcript_24645/m.38723 type:complete len:445 (+) Transcript_24645:157-1491(+)
MAQNEISVEERKDMLQKLDEMNQGRGSFFTGNTKSSSKKCTAASLLSTLLYMALMAFKVEDMKAMLKQIDFESYEQWDALLAVLHSPEFHVKERSLQNKRATRTFDRKNHYKTKAAALNDQLDKTSCKLDEVQRISNETNNEMSKTINVLQQEVSELNHKLHAAHAKIELERESVLSLKDKAKSKDLVIDGLNQQLDTANQDVHVLQQEVSEQNIKLQDAHEKVELERKAVQSLKDKVTSKDAAIDNLNKQLGTANDKIHDAAKELCESKSRVEYIESQFDSYKKEKETQVNELKQNLIKAESQNESLSGQLASLSDSLQSKVALLCKSISELLDESKKGSNAQMEDRSTLFGINTRSQEIHEVLLQVKEQEQVDVDEIQRTIKSTICDELKVLHRTLERQVMTRPSSDEANEDKRVHETNNEPEYSATAFVHNVLSEAVETTS